ncbi:MAG: efflux RND transporter periplasmic adaptor subunit [Bacteroidetes bacterium]|nr:efflux RND transporter periplasmic adaptor subunit [Bacteroidota bacterium]
MNYLKLVLSIFIIVFISCKNGNKEQANKKDAKPVKVDVLIASENNFPSTVEVNGTVLSEEMVSLYPEISGRITFLNLPDGDFIKQGTVLVKINDADLQAQLEQQKVALDLAEKTETRLKQLLSVNGIDQATYDAALNEVNTRKANIKVINAQIDKTVIKAPFSGTLGLRQVSIGAYVNTQTLLGTLQQTDKIKIDFSAPEAYSSIIHIGDTVIVKANSSNEKLKAIINAIEPQINTSTRNLKVRAYLVSGTIFPGTFVKVSLIENKSAITVPTNAIIPDALSNQLAIIKNGKTVFKNVETGDRNADMVEIKSGINAGDSVIVSGVLFVRAGGKVVVKKVKN